ncbi:MAG: hypothetical protein LBU34_04580 [Planctomycetaceae bacterium]|nr:hypothetical protein [Planctomycetaceae bacterium]
MSTKDSEVSAKDSEVLGEAKPTDQNSTRQSLAERLLADRQSKQPTLYKFTVG